MQRLWVPQARILAIAGSLRSPADLKQSLPIMRWIASYEHRAKHGIRIGGRTAFPQCVGVVHPSIDDDLRGAVEPEEQPEAPQELSPPPASGIRAQGVALFVNRRTGIGRDLVEDEINDPLEQLWLGTGLPTGRSSPLQSRDLSLKD